MNRGLPRRLAAAALALLAACSERPATIVGDAYLVLESGREIDLVGEEVRLVAEPEEERLDSLLIRMCRSRTPQEAARLAASPEAWERRTRILTPLVRRTVRTDSAASFAIDSVPAGRYRLWAETRVDGERWTWLHDFRVRAGDSVRINLSNANADEDPFRCLLVW